MTRLILLDIDGTLLWTRGAGRESTRLAMLETFGTAGAIDTHTFSGKTDWQTLSELLHGHTPPETIASVLPAYNDTVGRHLDAIIHRFEVTPTPGALEAVASLRARADLVLGLVTGNPSRAAHAKLRAAGFDPAWFPIGAYGHEAYHRDELPALALERAAQHWGMAFPPERVIVVGDTVMDVSCARAVGALAAVVLTGYESREALEQAQPDALFDTLTEFAAWV